MPSSTSYMVKLSWGEALRLRRLRKKLTQTMLVERIGMSKAIISNYEAGRAIPNVIAAHKIAKSLDWTVEEWAKEAERLAKDASWLPYRTQERARQEWQFYGRR